MTRIEWRRNRASDSHRTGWAWAALAAGLTLAALFSAGCEPRKIEPNAVDRVVAAAAAETQYRRIVLANGMQVMLISDPDAERSAAAMAVGAGSLSDPPERAGLAHFLEHMLFLGTEKYPEPEGYQQFATQHAGFTNAYTADDHTNYFFQISHDAFPEALDRFAQFFIAPSFDEGYVAREMNAVDSEHSKNLASDGWRIQQVMRDVMDEGHPIRRFSTGSLATLKDVTRAELLAFYRAHYSANRMTLAVVGNQPLDAQEALVRERFAAVENRDLLAPRFPEVFLAPKAALRVVTVEPVADQRSLVLTFPLPALQKEYAAKPLQLINFVLGHEGPGSILSVLKAENLATSLGAGGGESTDAYSSIELRIGLTPEGLARHEEVVAKVLGAIRYFRDRGMPHHLFEENQVMAALDFRHQTKDDSATRATRMAALMQALPPEALPEGAFLYSRFDAALYESVWNRLTADNMLVTLIAKGVPTGRREKHYDAAYGYAEQTGEPYERIVAAAPDARIHWPEPNPFIPHLSGLRRPEGALRWTYTSQLHAGRDGLPIEAVDRLAKLEGTEFPDVEAFVHEMQRVVPGDGQEAALPALLQNATPVPARILDGERGMVWFLPDWRFRQPRAQMVLEFRVPGVYGSPREAVLAQLYQMGWEEALNEFGYPVRQAGLGYALAAGKTGMVLTLSGYSPRMLELLGKLVPRLREVKISEDTFASLRERYVRALQNQRFSQPYEQSRYYKRLMLEDPTISHEALEEALASVTLADLQAFARNLYDRVYLEGVVVGSLDPKAVRIALSDALDTLGGAPLPASERRDATVRALPPGSDYVFTERLDINNSLIDLSVQVGETNPALRGALLLAARSLQESFFFNMRTRQQLGYIVYAGMGQMKKTLSLVFLVQSGQYPADTLLTRVEAFIPEWVREFEGHPDAQFERYRAAVNEAKLERAKDLDEVADRLRWIAFENDEKWDYVSEDIKAMEGLTRQQVNVILREALLSGTHGRLVIRLVGKDHVAGPVKGTPVKAPEELKAG